MASGGTLTRSCVDLEEINKTNDPNEVTFKSTKLALPIWRSVFKYRYCVDLPKTTGCKTSWTDYSKKQGTLCNLVCKDNENSELKVYPLDIEWAQTTIRITHNQVKILTIHKC